MPLAREVQLRCVKYANRRVKFSLSGKVSEESSAFFEFIVDNFQFMCYNNAHAGLVHR